MRTVVIFVNYGPYHLSRATAFAAREPQAHFIELASSQKLYPWKVQNDALNGRLLTLEDNPYEQCGRRALNRKLIACLETIAPDVIAIAGYSESPMRGAARWARRRGVAVVMMSETARHDAPRHRLRELAKRRWIAQHVDSALVGGGPHRTYMRALGIPDSRIWEGYDVVDNYYFARCAAQVSAEGTTWRRRLGLPESYFLYVGRFAPEKNLPLLLGAYRLYREKNPAGWDLVMVGDGPDRSALEALAGELGITVLWPGFIQMNILPAYYALAGCFVLPSVREPWGLVVNEAMASGLPILVSSRCGSAMDLVHEGRNGFQFSHDDSRRLAELMGMVSPMDAKELSAMGAESSKIIAGWTPAIWAAQLQLAARAACGSVAKTTRDSHLRAAVAEL